MITRVSMNEISYSMNFKVFFVEVLVLKQLNNTLLYLILLQKRENFVCLKIWAKLKNLKILVALMESYRESQANTKVSQIYK